MVKGNKTQGKGKGRWDVKEQNSAPTSMGHALARTLACSGIVMQTCSACRDVGPATPAIELGGDQLRELGRDVRHRIFCSNSQTASRGEHGADIAESFERRAVRDGDELVTR